MVCFRDCLSQSQQNFDAVCHRRRKKSSAHLQVIYCKWECSTSGKWGIQFVLYVCKNFIKRTAKEISEVLNHLYWSYHWIGKEENLDKLLALVDSQANSFLRVSRQDDYTIINCTADTSFVSLCNKLCSFFIFTYISVVAKADQVADHRLEATKEDQPKKFTAQNRATLRER